MLLRRELLLAIGSLVGLNLLLAFGVIGLLVRMGPAIDRILQENVTSIMAGEAILTEFASDGDQPLAEESRARVRAAFERARDNVTEDAERPVIARLEDALDAEEASGAGARPRAVAAVRELISINRDAMVEVDHEARRLGLAGAWASVFVGFVSFLLSLAILALLRRRFLTPVLELHDVIDRVAGGDRFRRCRSMDAPLELTAVTTGLNALLDAYLAPSQPSEEEDSSLDLEALELLLERQAGPVVLVDARGAIMHANEAALEALADDEGQRIHAALEAPAEHTAEGSTPIRAIASPSGGVYLCLLSA